MNKQIKVYNDFLPKEIFDPMQKSFLGYLFPWYYIPYIDYPTDKNTFQFIHWLKRKEHPTMSIKDSNDMYSNYFPLVKHLIDKINPKKLLGVKSNLIPRTHKIQNGRFHTDMEGSEYHNVCKTAIFYLNTNNGFTYFKDKTKIKSVENKLIIFPGNMPHRGTSCTNEKVRVVININYI